jgi:hypothetical protein
MICIIIAGREERDVLRSWDAIGLIVSGCTCYCISATPLLARRNGLTFVTAVVHYILISIITQVRCPLLYF